MQGLLDDLAKALKDGKHFHIGSVGMWKKHEEAREKMQEGLDNFEIRGVSILLFKIIVSNI